MRTMKLLVCGAVLAALTVVPTGRASADVNAVEETPAPLAAIETSAGEVPVTDAQAAADAASAVDALLGGEAAAPEPSTLPEEIAAGDPAMEAATGDPTMETATGDPAMEAATGDPTMEAAAGDPTMEAAAGDPTMEAATGDPTMEAATGDPAASTRELGQIGYDSEGRPGRIHIVVSGDTLWDISDAYLGTPWVWPSIWTDNRGIENPHLIHPGDHIWITDSEMRVISRAEAEAMRSARPEEPPAAAPELVETIPVALPMDAVMVPEEQGSRRVSVREWVGLISSRDLEAAASIVREVAERVMLAQLDRVYIGLGEGDVQVGDQFEIIRPTGKVKDPETGRFLGHHVDTIGWLEVVEVHSETSLAWIRLSTEDVRVGDRLIPRRPETLDIPVRPSPEEVEGRIAFFPHGRAVIGPLDFVYLNRGGLDGLEAGSQLDVIRAGDRVKESVRRETVEVPERVVARLFVVDAQPETAVALVAETETDLLVGDTFRGAAP